MKDYDKVILEHYRNVAVKDGDGSGSTMADSRTRSLETDLITTFFQAAIDKLVALGRSEESIVVADFGCGNGCTLEALSRLNGRPKFIGFEYSPDLRRIAEKRFVGKKIEVRPVDIREANTVGEEIADIVICQRVLINLLDSADQTKARDNIVRGTTRGGHLLFLECFKSGLEKLNAARAEFGLSPLPPAHHNLYLDDNYFDCTDLSPWSGPAGVIHENFLSTHYFVTRVLHPLLLGNRPFQRNSPFTSFFSQALNQNIGDFSPIRACVFNRVR